MGLFRRRFSLVLGTAFVVLTVLGFNYLPIPGDLSGPLAHLQHTPLAHLQYLQQAQAQGGRMRPIVLGQTEGWAKGELTVFDYTANFVCANSVLNTADCLVGMSPTPLNLPGLRLDAARTPDLIVIVPLFQGPDGDGIIEALDPEPGVFVQCPENQSSVLNGGTPEFGQFGHCILHDTMLDTSPLAGVTVAGVTFGGTIPLVNHTHIVQATPGGSVPWDVFVVLVTNSAIWPDQFGSCPAGSGCLTSFAAISAAPAGSVVGPVPTTLFLFFGVHGLNP